MQLKHILKLSFLEKVIIFLILFKSVLLHAKEKTNHIDSLKSLTEYYHNNDSLFANTCWHIAKYYDELNKFDSMQYWLNIGSEKLSITDTQLIHFNYAAFQSIAYYYNGLLQLDLYESLKVLSFAIKLNDSILLTTGYNYVGLAYSNIGEYKNAIPYFYKGMPYAKQPPYDAKYLVTSKPHHLHGNLAEAYYNISQYDSAMVNAKKSLDLASQIYSKRGTAVAKNLIGLIFFKLNNFDSALTYQMKAYNDGIHFEEKDVSLISCAAIANIFLQLNQKMKALEFISQGFYLKKVNPEINFYFTKQFLSEALDICYRLNSTKEIQKCLEAINENNSKIGLMTDQQVERIIHNAVNNETRANKLSLLESEQKRKITSLGFLLVLIAFIATVIFGVMHFNNNKKRIKEISIRQSISRDLHDDIGSTLSSIKLYSELSLQEQLKNSTKSIAITNKITSICSELMSRVSDTIFVLKHESINYEKLEEKIKSTILDTLKAKEIQSKILLEPSALKRITMPYTIKNILLIIKEATNNIAKYSRAESCILKLEIKNGKLLLIISDNGDGISKNVKYGNGIANMKYRCEQMNGIFEIKSSYLNGCNIKCTFDLSIFR